MSDNRVPENIIIDMAIESWRFLNVFKRFLKEADAGQGNRYIGQVRFFAKKLDENLASAHMRIVDLEGQAYDPGQAVKALNLEEFSDAAELIITQMLEPIIMGEESVIRQGVVIVERK